MKVQVEKGLLDSTLDKMYQVSTKALIPNFNFAGKITIEAKDSGRIVFTSSNGCITAQQEILNSGTSAKGICSTDAVKLRNAVKKIKVDSPSSVIELTTEGDMLHIRDITGSRRRLVKLPCDKGNHTTTIVKQPDTDVFHMESDFFLRGVHTVIPFQDYGTYKMAYQVVCFHWLAKETRCICGNGGMFAIFSFPRNSKDTSKKAFKRTILISQLAVLASLIEDSSSFEMSWKDKTTLWVKTDGGLEMLARGLPEVEYIDYEVNAFRFDEAVAYVDVKAEDLREVTELLTALQDKERADQGKTHSCFMTVPSKPGHVQFEIRKKQGKFQCEYEIPADYYNLKDKEEFTSRYAHVFFSTPAGVMQNPYLRLFLIDELRTANARDVDLGDPDRDGVPVEKESADGANLSFFFAALADDEDDEEENEEE